MIKKNVDDEKMNPISFNGENKACGQTDNKSYIPRLISLWVIIFFTSLLIMSTAKQPIAMSYLPTFPRKGEPLMIRINSFNPNTEPHRFRVNVYMDGSKITEWTATLGGWGIGEHELIIEAGDLLGRSKRVYVELTDLDLDAKTEAFLMIPPYPPETLTSFVSFASFSTTVMSYMQTFAYYRATVIPEAGINVGLAISLTLITVLVFEELSDPSYGPVGRRILELRERYGRLTFILLAIFFSMVFTKVALILWGM